MWKSGRQGVPALSTAESELIEAIEGVIMGDSVDVMIQELSKKPYVKIVKVDNQAAVNLLSEPAGSWRTRHLRLRAAHLQWRLSRTDWMTEAIPGAEQVADVGTKVMTAPRLEEMRKMLSMETVNPRIGGDARPTCLSGGMHPPGGDAPREGGEHPPLQEDELARVLRMVILIGGIHQAKAQEEDEEREDINLDFLGVIAVLVLAAVGTFNLIVEGIKLFQKIREKPKKEGDPQSGGEKEKKGEDEEGSDARPTRPSGGMHLPSGVAPQEGGVHPLTGTPDPSSEAKEEEKKEEENGSVARPTRLSGGMHLPSGVAPQEGGVHPLSGATSSSSHGTVVPSAPLPKPRRRVAKNPALLTEWGARWHSQKSCPTLANSKRIYASQWCDVCADQDSGAVPIYCAGLGKTAHYDEDCSALARHRKVYHKCQTCSDRLERTA